MFIDDRLATVLRQPGTGEAARRTQFRQLLDILGNRKFGPQDAHANSLVAAAWLRMDALARAIPPQERAAMIREPSWRFRSADLAAHLADFEPEVASAALNRAQLSPEDWTALIPRLPVRARGFLRLRRDLPVDAERLLDRLGVHDRGLPSPASGSKAPSASAVPLAAPEPSEGLIEEGAETDGAPQTGQAEEQEPEQEQGPEQDYPGPRRSSEQRLSSEPPPKPRPRERAMRDPIETGRSEISALVERIAQFKRTREAPSSDADRSPRLPLGEEQPVRETRAMSFGFAADAGGRIGWADAEVAAMVIGTRLATTPMLGERRQRSELEKAFDQRQPIIGASMELLGAAAITGEWVVDAQPRFSDDGSFQGYVGRFRRLPGADEDDPSTGAREADRIRQLLHELRTPITAIQGYAEVIQQTLFGPAPHEYRALAAVIAADAARILAGFEELDRLSRLEGGLAEMNTGEADLGDITQRTVAQLAQVLGPRMAGIALSIAADEPMIAALDHDEAEMMLWRLLATLGGGCATGETLRAVLSAGGIEARLTIDIPAQLRGEEDIFVAEAKPIGGTINAGLFGAGFALRLVRAEARALGGELIRNQETLSLRLPLVEAMPLTTTAEANSPDGMRAGQSAF